MATFFGGQNFEILEFTATISPGATNILFNVPSNSFAYLQSIQISPTAGVGGSPRYEFICGYSTSGRESFTTGVRNLNGIGSATTDYVNYLVYDYNNGNEHIEDNSGASTSVGVPVGLSGQQMKIISTSSSVNLSYKITIVHVTGK